MNDKKNPYLHIYSHLFEHDDVYIIGNTAGLKRLRDALDRALMEQRNTVTRDVYVGDGEGYMVIIMPFNEDAWWPYIAEPYTDKYAKERRERAIRPWRLLTREEHNRLIEQNAETDND